MFDPPICEWLYRMCLHLLYMFYEICMMFKWHVWTGVILYNNYVISDSYELNRINRNTHKDTDLYMD